MICRPSGEGEDRKGKTERPNGGRDGLYAVIADRVLLL
jgi:hypothetical protein